MFLILLAFERVYFDSILWPSRSRNVSTNAEQLCRGRHGRNSPAAPGARPAQTSSLLHLMGTDVPEDDLEFWEQIYLCRKESVRGFNGVE